MGGYIGGGPDEGKSGKDGMTGIEESETEEWERKWARKEVMRGWKMSMMCGTISGWIVEEWEDE